MYYAPGFVQTAGAVGHREEPFASDVFRERGSGGLCSANTALVVEAPQYALQQLGSNGKQVEAMSPEIWPGLLICPRRSLMGPGLT